jgi:hypothetical protein
LKRQRVGQPLRIPADAGRFAWNAFAFDHRIAARVDGEHQDHRSWPTVALTLAP